MVRGTAVLADERSRLLPAGENEVPAAHGHVVRGVHEAVMVVRVEPGALGRLRKPQGPVEGGAVELVVEVAGPHAAAGLRERRDATACAARGRGRGRGRGAGSGSDRSTSSGRPWSSDRPSWSAAAVVVGPVDVVGTAGGRRTGVAVVVGTAVESSERPSSWSSASGTGPEAAGGRCTSPRPSWVRSQPLRRRPAAAERRPPAGRGPLGSFDASGGAGTWDRSPSRGVRSTGASHGA